MPVKNLDCGTWLGLTNHSDQQAWQLYDKGPDAIVQLVALYASVEIIVYFCK